MNAAKNERTYSVEIPDVEINGGVSAGEQNGSRVEKIDPISPPNTSCSPGMAQVATVAQGELINKQAGNQTLENRAQGKVPVTPEYAERVGIALPPEAPIQLRGRPSILTPQILEQLCQLLSLGFSRAQAAAYLGMDRSTLTRAAARDPELKAELQRAEEVSDLQPQLTVIAEARKNWRAAAWLLQFKARHHPRQPTEADKQEQHQDRLADIRRDNEAFNVLCGKEPAPQVPVASTSRKGKR